VTSAPPIARLHELGDDAERLLRSPYSPETPLDAGGGTPNHAQIRFLLFFGLEALYGGAAGGGKSSALLLAALQFVEVPGYTALMLRRTFRDLAEPGALMDRAHRWLRPTAAQWSSRDRSWTFPSGARLVFGYVESDRDVYKYDSAEYQFIAFDELTQFSEWQYRFLFGRLRKPSDPQQALSKVPLRMRAASNPGGRGHEWVHRRLVRPDPTPQRQFIPARLEDNPAVDRDAYRSALAQLDPVTRAQREQGDWGARRLGGYFDRSTIPVVEAEDVPDRLPHQVRYWDLASTVPSADSPDPDYTVGVRLARSRDGRWWVLDVQRVRAGPDDVERLVAATHQRDGPTVAVRMEEEGGASGRSLIDYYRRQVLPGADFAGRRPTGDKITRATGVSSQSRAGHLHLVAGSWNDEFLDELEVFGLDGGHDDQVDALSGAFAEIVRWVTDAEAVTPVELPAGDSPWTI